MDLSRPLGTTTCHLSYPAAGSFHARCITLSCRRRAPNVDHSPMVFMENTATSSQGGRCCAITTRLSCPVLSCCCAPSATSTVSAPGR
ncbi:unnamed protein product [Boreogadus saida]